MLTYGVEAKPFQMDHKGRGEGFVLHIFMRRDTLIALLAAPLVIVIKHFMLEMICDQALQLVYRAGLRLVRWCIERDVDGDAVEGVAPRTREGARCTKKHIYIRDTDRGFQEKHVSE